MSNREALTAKQVEHMKPSEHRQEIPAGPPKGLYLVVYPSGVKSWCFRYRHRGRTRKVTFDAAGVAAARAEAEAMLKSLDNDNDPAVVRAEEAKEAKPDTVKAVADEWVKRALIPPVRESSKREFKRILDKEVLPLWRDKYITEIRKADVLRVVDAIVDRDRPSLANKTLAVMKMFLNWAANDRDYIDASPAAGISPPSPNVPRERVLDLAELTEVWKASGALGYFAGPFLRFLILSAQRRGEVASMQWAEVDMEKSLWTIPGEKTKNGRTHFVPLTKAMKQLLATLPRWKGGDAVWTTTSGATSINGFSNIKERIDAEMLQRRTEAAERAGLALSSVENIAAWTMHDLRRTATTFMAEPGRVCPEGVLPHVLSAVLNHTTAGAAASMQGAAITFKVYNRYEYLTEKRAALDAWSKFVLSLDKDTTTRKRKAAAASA